MVLKTVRSIRENGRPARNTAERRDTASPAGAGLLRALLDDSESGILLLDPERRVAEINQAARRLLSLTSAACRRPAGELVKTVLPGDDPVAEAYRSTRTEREVMLAARHGEIPVLLRSYRLGKPPWVLLTLLDLTHMRRMQQELRRHERLATLGQLSAGVAHEINTPLAIMMGYCQLLEERVAAETEEVGWARTCRRAGGLIRDAVGRLIRIVRVESTEASG